MFTFDHEEQFIGICMFMPDKFALNFDQFDLVIIQFLNNLGCPVFIEQGQLILKIDFISFLTHHASNISLATVNSPTINARPSNALVNFPLSSNGSPIHVISSSIPSSLSLK